ncbi:hypothetical protein V7S43_006754 [Phytophthora oleae]|uniref:Uncharacterized protein n=1 Tax=Phytophthora oleae TaxID=2107226 RepID=A0ABD3FMB9_9STRA
MDYEQGDGALVPQPYQVDMSLYDGEDVVVTQETTRTMSVQRNTEDRDARHQLDQQAQIAAAAHNFNSERTSRVQ